MKFLHLENYRDPTYRYVIITCLLAMVLIGDILSPILNYVAIALPKGSPEFNNYATIASIAPGLPFMFAFLISLVVNNLRYRYVLIGCFSVSILTALILLRVSEQHFMVLTAGIVLISFLFRSLYYSLDRQLTTILIDKIRDYQSDIFILGGVIGAINFKLSALIYAHYQISGIILLFIIGCGLLTYCAAKIPPVAILESKAPQDKIKLADFLSLIFHSRELLKFLVIMSLGMLLGGVFNILLMTKIHHDQIGLASYGNLISISMLTGIVSSLACKTHWLNRLLPVRIIALSFILSGMCILGMSFNQGIVGFGVCYLLFNAFNNITLIQMSSLLFRHISLDTELIKFSPLINGTLGSLFYALSVIGQLSTNLALNHEVSYAQIFMVIALANFVLAVSLLRLKDQPQY